MNDHHIYSDKFTAILNNLFYGVLLLTEDGVIQEFNKASLHILQKPLKDVQDKKLVDLLQPTYREKFQEYFTNCLHIETKNYGKYEISYFLEDHQLKIIEIDCNQSFISEEDGKLYIICVVNDITKRKKLEKELEDQKRTKEAILEKLEREQELSDMKSSFISLASHEFRTPLAGILSSIDLIERYLTIDPQLWNQFTHHIKVESHVGKIKTSVKTLTATLNQFLSLGQLEEGKIEYHEEDFDLEATLQKFTDDFRPLLKLEQTIQYKFNSLIREVKMDKNILMHILNNVLSNAVKYSPENSTIYLQALVDEHNIFITIRDEGMGIPDTDQKNMFKRFFRAKNATNLQGTGLGLNIVKKYVELMNGTISFESKENVGTVFKLQFDRISKLSTDITELL